MPLLTATQITSIKAGNLSHFTKEDVFSRDQDGHTLLHHLTLLPRTTPYLLRLIEQALSLGSSPYLSNRTLKTPLDIAIDTQKWDIAQLLLSQPLAYPSEYLEQMLATATHYYSEIPSGADRTSEQDKILVFIASRLCGVDVAALFNAASGEGKTKYNAHLQWLNGKSGMGRHDLEGFHQHQFLPLRLLMTLKSYAQLFSGEIRLDTLPPLPLGTKTLEHYLDFLRQNIAELLQSIFILRMGRQLIDKGPELSALVTGICKSASTLQVDEGRTIPITWGTATTAHATYLRLQQTHTGTMVLVNNLGEAYPAHHTTQTVGAHPHVLPYAVGLVTDRTAWASGTLVFTYLSELLSSVFGVQAGIRYNRAYVEPKLYRTHRELGITAFSAHSLPAQLHQLVGNCVVANHDACRWLSGNPAHQATLVKWLVIEERKNVAAFGYDGELPALAEAMWDDIATATHLGTPGYVRAPDPIEISASAFDTLLRRHYKNQFAEIPGWLSESALPMDEYYVSLELIKQKKSSEKTSAGAGSSVNPSNQPAEWVRESMEFSALLQQPGKQWVTGPAGAGKSTLAKAMMYQWAKGSLIPSTDIHHVIWLPLRDLLSRDCYAGAQTAIHDWVVETLGESIGLNLRPHLFAKESNILWVLDGFDEVSQDLSLEQKKVREMLLAMPHAIITTRPHVMSALTETAHIEVTGFNDPQLKTFIKNQLDAQARDKIGEASMTLAGAGSGAGSSTAKATPQHLLSTQVERQSEEILSYLEINPSLKTLARLPINAKLICYTASKGMLDLSQSRLTAIYQQLFLALHEYAREREESLLHHEMTPEEMALFEQKWEISQKILQQLANQAMADNQFIIKGEQVQAAISTIQQMHKRERFALKLQQARLTTKTSFTDLETDRLIALEEEIRISEALIGTNWLMILLNTGLVQKAGGRDSRPHLEFAHLSLQEFLAAQSVYERLESEDPSTFSAWFKAHKLKDYYQLTWRFVTGMITETSLADRWLDHLMDAPWSLVGYTEVKRLAHHLSECANRRMFTKGELLYTTLRDTFLDQMAHDTSYDNKAIGILAELGFKDAVVRDTLLARIDDPKLTYSATTGLVALGFKDKIVRDALLARVDSSASNSIIFALGELGFNDTSVRDALLSRLFSSNSDAILNALNKLGFNDIVVRNALLAKIDDVGGDDSESDSDGGIGSTMIDMLAKLRCNDMVVKNALLARLNHENKGIRNSVNEALGELYPKDATARSMLLTNIGHKKGNIRRSTIRGLAELGCNDVGVHSALLSKINDKHPSVQRAVINALAQLELKDSAVRTALLAKIHDPNKETKEAAIEALIELGFNDAIVQSALLAKIVDPELTAEVINALAELGLNGPAVRIALLAKTKDPKGDVRGTAISALAKLGFRDNEVRDALLARIDDVETSCYNRFISFSGGTVATNTANIEVINALGTLNFNDISVQDALLARIDREVSKCRVIIALIQLGFNDLRVRDALLAKIDDPGWLSASAPSQLQLALGDRGGSDSRNLIIQALDKLGFKDDDLRDKLLARLDHPNEKVRRNMIEALAGLGFNDECVHERLLAKLIDLADPTPKYAIIQAIATLGFNDMDVRDALLAHIDHLEAYSRDAALDVFRKLHFTISSRDELTRLPAGVHIILPFLGMLPAAAHGADIAVGLTLNSDLQEDAKGLLAQGYAFVVHQAGRQVSVTCTSIPEKVTARLANRALSGTIEALQESLPEGATLTTTEHTVTLNIPSPQMAAGLFTALHGLKTADKLRTHLDKETHHFDCSIS